jgi:hypothetical protein
MDSGGPQLRRHLVRLRQSRAATHSVLLADGASNGCWLRHRYSTVTRPSAPSASRVAFDYAAIGTVSNVASRLCDEAKPGQILISPRVLTKVENAVTVEPVGEFELKGIRRPLAAYNVLAAMNYWTIAFFQADLRIELWHPHRGIT